MALFSWPPWCCNSRRHWYIMPTQNQFFLISWFWAKQLDTVTFCMLWVWHKMIFAWEQLWEQLYLLLFKPLLKCFENRLCLSVERVEPSSAGAWMHWSRLRNHCQGLTNKFTLTPSYSQPQGKQSQLILELIWRRIIIKTEVSNTAILPSLYFVGS